MCQIESELLQLGAIRSELSGVNGCRDKRRRRLETAALRQMSEVNNAPQTVVDYLINPLDAFKTEIRCRFGG